MVFPFFLPPEFWGDLVSRFPDMIHFISPEGKLLFANIKATQLLGYTMEELLSLNIDQLYAPHLKEQVKRDFEELKLKGFKESTSSLMICKDGKEVPVEVRSLCLYDNEKKFISTLSIIRDVAEIRDLRSQMVQQSKLAAIGELANGIIHDIRNPLTIITAYNNSFLPEAISEKNFEMIGKCQEHIQKAAAKIQRLTEHLSEYSRSHPLASEIFNLGEVLDNSLLILESRIREAKATVRIDPQLNALELNGSAHKLEQVIINILGNACDALENSEKKMIFLKLLSMSEDFLEISIQDTGPGVLPAQKEKIFEAFYTTKPPKKGTGLGLSISQGLLREQGGELTLKEKERTEDGAEFILKIPKNVNNPSSSKEKAFHGNVI